MNITGTLNNNGVVVIDDNNNVLVIMGSGLGFHKNYGNCR
ncbi:CAT RNA binding domain-containing protein [Dickeya chrysanthemi]